MAVYYPGYTYLFVHAPDNHFSPCLRPLQKEFIRAVLQDLHDIAHHVYVLLEHLPENRFAIVRYYDHVRSLMQHPVYGRDDAFTLRQFLQHYDLLHERDEFRVIFFTEVFYYEQSFTPHVLEIVYRHYLKYVCRQNLRENAPLRLTPDLVREYGLSEAEAQKTCTYIEECNTSIAADVQAEYNALKNIDCIEK